MEALDKTFPHARTEAVLFHKSCTDGFAAAWVAHAELGNEGVFYHAVAHGDEPPWDHVRDKNVLVVDFSWPRDVTLQIKSVAKGFVLLDHHATAAKRLAGIAGCRFDAEQCGATLAFIWFQTGPGSRGARMPEVLAYVRDRDTWSWGMPQSREFSAALYVEVPFDFDEWDARFADYNEEALTIASMKARGALYRAYEIKMAEGVAKWAREIEFRGHRCRAAQVSPRALVSEVGDAILRLHPDARVALCWSRDDWTGLHKVSLRAREVDVASLAEEFGGGGHPAAAAFSIDLGGRDVAALFALPSIDVA